MVKRGRFSIRRLSQAVKQFGGLSGSVVRRLPASLRTVKFLLGGGVPFQFFQARFDSGNVAGISAGVALGQRAKETQCLLVVHAGFFDPVLVAIQYSQYVQRLCHAWQVHLRFLLCQLTKTSQRILIVLARVVGSVLESIQIPQVV